mmetsp:Transcript_20039/g.40604  ORF Transcript_20039/g.40604 Transcript_20039/m.40604 type:complete len:372 (-) Transcript_20039:91-1206(-)
MVVPSAPDQSETVAPNCRPRYTDEDTSPLNPANQPPPPSSAYRCALCLLSTCRGVMSLCRLALGTRRSVAVFAGGIAVLSLIAVNRTALTFVSDEVVGTMGTIGLHDLARNESLGFFDRVPRRRWKKMKRLARKRRKKAEAMRARKGDDPSKFGSVSDFYEVGYPSELTCPGDTRVGGDGPGSRWVCDPGRIAKIGSARSHGREIGLGGCLVYSSGKREDGFDFESALLDVLGGEKSGCEIHVFRPGMAVAAPKGLTVHDWGFKGSRMDVQGSFKSMQETVGQLDHGGRTVDLFVLDCNGCEFDTFRDWFQSGVVFTQILVRVHSAPTVINAFFTTLEEQGYAVFHRQPDKISKGDNQDYSFLRLRPEFFE